MLPLVWPAFWSNLCPRLLRGSSGDKTGKAVEVVTGAAKQVFGTDDPASLERALAADPAKALEFKRIVLEAEGQERERQHQETLARIVDVQNARGQTVELAKANSAIAWGAPIISAIVLVAFGAALLAVLKEEVPAGSLDIANIMLGTLGAMASAVVGYWVGSSAGSAVKDNALRQMAGK